jgi:hypothetical protein
MMRWTDIGRPFGFRRKKTLADRAKDVAEDVVDRFQDVAEDVVDRVQPVIRRSGETAHRARGVAEDVVGRFQDVAEDAVERVQPALRRSGKTASRTWEDTEKRAGKALASTAVLASLARARTERGADLAADRAREAIETTRERLTPVLRHSGKLAESAISRTAESASAGLSSAERASREAAHAAAAGGAAAAGATVGFFGAVGGFFGAVLRGLWSLTVFLVKAGIIAAVAYAGWEWLQSRRASQKWSTPGGPGYSPPTSDGTGGGAYNATGGYASPAGSVR